jgi:hypothetical protein
MSSVPFLERGKARRWASRQGPEASLRVMQAAHIGKSLCFLLSGRQPFWTKTSPSTGNGLGTIVVRGRGGRTFLDEVRLATLDSDWGVVVSGATLLDCDIWDSGKASMRGMSSSRCPDMCWDGGSVVLCRFGGVAFAAAGVQDFLLPIKGDGSKTSKWLRRSTHAEIRVLSLATLCVVGSSLCQLQIRIVTKVEFT